MDTSRRAVESYWRSRMIDSATSDEDKVTPVYKLEEICELLRSSSSGIVKEVSEFLLKRLDHKSPIVKQKALRVIKYSVGKSGPEFRREMQRNSVSVKNLLHYKGQPDPLKGDSLNKAVRETAQDALSAIFSTDDIKPAISEVTHKRMEGFGNTNYVRPQEEKKSFLSEVVDIGSASIKQGLSTLAQAHSQSFKKNDTGTYRGPTLNRSLTNEFDHSDRYDKASYHGGSQGSSSNSRNAKLGNWGQDSRTVSTEIMNDLDSGSGYAESKTREERFLETIVTSGGVRLQPTRDALQVFLMEATKMDALALCRALEAKLQSPHWQVRVKAVCVLEAILRKRDDEQFAMMASYFLDHIDVVIKCSESPQSSLREKANRVLTLLEGDQTGNTSQKPTKIERTVVEMPDLIDTGDNDLLGEDPKESQNDQVNATNQSTSSLLIDDLFGGSTINDQTKSESKTDDDPFADVSFHTSENKDQGSDLFAGMTLGENPSNVEAPKSSNLDPFDIFGPPMTSDVNNLMAGLSVNGNGSVPNEIGTSTESQFPGSNPNFGSQGLNETLGGGFDPQKKGASTTNTSVTFPMGSTIPYSIPPGMMYNQFYPVGPNNVNPMLPMGMGGLLSQQQLMAAMANIQSLGSLNSHNFGGGNGAGTFGGNVSPLPDIFNAHMPAQTPTVTMSAPKEETKAFDFITDHMTQARDSKRLM